MNWWQEEIDYDTDLTDWTIPASRSRESAARLAEKVHTVRHPDTEPAECRCYETWRTHPTFGKLIKWQRSVNRQAALRLEGE